MLWEQLVRVYQRGNKQSTVHESRLFCAEGAVILCICMRANVGCIISRKEVIRYFCEAISASFLPTLHCCYRSVALRRTILKCVKRSTEGRASCPQLVKQFNVMLGTRGAVKMSKNHLDNDGGHGCHVVNNGDFHKSFICLLFS